MKSTESIIIRWIMLFIIIFFLLHIKVRIETKIDYTVFFSIFEDLYLGVSDNLEFDTEIFEELTGGLNQRYKDHVLLWLLINQNELLNNKDFIDYCEKICKSKMELYSTIGDIYWEKSQKETAYTYYLKALENIRNKINASVNIRLLKSYEDSFLIERAYSRLIEFEKERGDDLKTSEYEKELSNLNIEVSPIYLR